tara:strand:- start:67 stop:2205 length:2139 start_codon:yes stop_codon:yes gene_type:complete
MIYDKKNVHNHILFITMFHIGIQKIGKVKWYPFTYNGEITDYEASNTGLVRNKNTKEIFKSSKPTLKRLKRLAEKANNKLGEHYLRVTISNLKTEKEEETKANFSVHKIVYCAYNNIDFKNIPKNNDIDHFNRCRFDNRATNLRCVPKKINALNKDTTNMKDRYCTLSIYLYKYEGKMNGRKTRKHIFESKTDPEFIKFKKENEIPKGAFNKGNLIGGIKKTNQQRCLSKKKFAFYNENNKFIVEEILEEYINEDELEIIGESENAHNAAKFLKEKTEYDTGNSDSNTIRGQIWKSIKKNKVIYGNIICKKGKKYTLKQGEITKDIKIDGKTFQATSFGNILQNGKKCYTPMFVDGYYMFRKERVHHIIYAAFNNLSIKDLKNKLTPNGKREYTIDHASQKNKTDNSNNNLEMITSAENTQKARDAGQIAGQISGTIINETTGEEFSFNHIPQSAEFLQKQKGFIRLKISSLRTWIQKALKDGVKYLSECKFMDGSCEKPVAVYNKTGTILIGIFNSITEALNSDEVKNKMSGKRNINLKNIKLYDTLIPNEIFDTFDKVVSYLQKINKNITRYKIKEVIDESRSHVNDFKITKENNKYYIYSKKAIKFNKEIVKKEFKTHDTFWKYIKDVYNLEGQKSTIFRKIINNNNTFKLQRGFPLFEISYDRIFAKKLPSCVCAGITKNKGSAYGLKWKYSEKEPMDVIKFENIKKH